MANANLSTASPRSTRNADGSGWKIAWGVLLIVAGTVALFMPIVAALGTALLFGWLMIFGGTCEIGYAIQGRAAPRFGWKLASGILTVVLGLIVLLMPIAGIAWLALLVGAFLLVGGITRAMLAFRLRPEHGWGWVMLDGVVSIVLAILIAIGWPQSSVAFIGLLTGFWLISAGVWRIMLRGVTGL